MLNSQMIILSITPPIIVLWFNDEVRACMSLVMDTHIDPRLQRPLSVEQRRLEL